MHTAPSPAVGVRLRTDALAAWAEEQKLVGDTAIAERLGLNRATLNRARRGDALPGQRLIAAVLGATGGTFEEFFEIAQVP